MAKAPVISSGRIKPRYGAEILALSVPAWSNLEALEEIEAMTRTRKISMSIIVLLIFAGAAYLLHSLSFATQQAVAAAFGMIVGLTVLGLACWQFPKLRSGVIQNVGYPGFGPISITALLGGLAGYWIFTLIMAG